MQSTKSQAAAEFITILSIILLVLLLIIIFNAKVMSDYAAKEEINKAVILLDTMESMGELVFAQGLGSQSNSLIRFPDEIENITISNQTIVIINKNGQTFHRNMDFNVSAGDLSNPNGRKLLYTRSIAESVLFSFYPINYTNAS